MKSFALLVAVLTATSFLIFVPKAACHDIDVGSARLGLSAPYTLKLPITRSCKLIPDLFAHFAPLPALAKVEVLGENIIVNDWSLSDKPHHVRFMLMRAEFYARRQNR